jgi:hypothetical protein
MNNIMSPKRIINIEVEFPEEIIDPSSEESLQIEEIRILAHSLNSPTSATTNSDDADSMPTRENTSNATSVVSRTAPKKLLFNQDSFASGAFGKIYKGKDEYGLGGRVLKIVRKEKVDNFCRSNLGIPEGEKVGSLRVVATAISMTLEQVKSVPHLITNILPKVEVTLNKDEELEIEMNLAKGLGIKDIMTQDKFSLDIVKISTQFFETLEGFAQITHTHGDLHSGNIFVDENSDITIIDVEGCRLTRLISGSIDKMTDDYAISMNILALMAKHYDILPDNKFQHYKGGVDDRMGLVNKLGTLKSLDQEHKIILENFVSPSFNNVYDITALEHHTKIMDRVKETRKALEEEKSKNNKASSGEVSEVESNQTPEEKLKPKSIMLKLLSCLACSSQGSNQTTV